MMTRLERRPHLLWAMLLVWCVASAAHAQFEIKGGAFNTLHRGTVPNAANSTPPILPNQPQFAGMAVTSGGSQAISDEESLAERHPAQVYVVAGTSTPTGAAIIHVRATFGFPFASGAPRYLFGDFIDPPTRDADGLELPAGSTYWRAEPVKPGETFTHVDGPQDAEPPVAANTTLNYHFSPNAERVFASQVGRVAITWVSRVPVATEGDSCLRYRYLAETFSVSPTSAKPVRTIYWNERGFNGPIMTLPLGNIEGVNPLYNAIFPATVATEFQPVGVSTDIDPTAAPAPERRTLWFDKLNGIGQLHAYNHEGRIIIEYLGKQKSGANSSYTFLGADVVEVVRSAPTINATVELGERITPRDNANRLLPLDGGDEWIGSPILSISPVSHSYYGSRTRADGIVEYFAERENSDPDAVSFYWLARATASIPSGANTPPVGLYWPKIRNAYSITWPDSLDAYGHVTVGATGSTTATGVPFAVGQLPELIFQDDGAQTETRLDTTTQRLSTIFTGSGDGLNRTLLKFTSGNEVWYVRLYTQADGRVDFAESDGAATPFAAPASVGQRLAPPSEEYSSAGYIVPGEGMSDTYDPVAYLDPFSVGVETAAAGAIIPVNAIPGEDELRVWWFKKVEPPAGGAFLPFYVPAKVGRYTVSWPSAADQIILASNAGSGDLPADQAAGTLYVQNDRAAAGFNPNEEHAMMLNGRVYAIRDDLNVTAAGPAHTSAPFVLLRYTSSEDQRPAMRVFEVVRETDTVRFDYPITAGTLVQPPLPLALLPLPLDDAGHTRNVEVAGEPDTAHLGPVDYDAFTFTDRKEGVWVYRGPHANGAPSFRMQFYYPSQAGFHVPGLATQPEPGTILPYLRPLVDDAPVGDPVTGTSLEINYRPVWPESAPSLRVAETLTLPKFGLPDVISQSSAQVLYQQSIAAGGATTPSVVLHDPIREKVFALGGTNQLAALPTSVLTTSSGGKTYFQRLPPHLRERCYFDPARGAKGSLVLLGKFVDEIAGDDYVQLNVLSTADRATLEGLVSDIDANRGQWLDAIAALSTSVETFIEDPAKIGSFKSDGAPTLVGPMALATITDSDTAAVDYALTATGAGSGWVTMVFGNGRAFTPIGEPVSVKVFQVAPQLYVGDLKVLPSPNPLDEQVSLRHSGDFAGEPDLYEFEWRHAPPVLGAPPAIYDYTQTARLGASWELVTGPADVLPTAAEYEAAATVTLPRTVQIIPAGAPADPATPGLVVRAVDGVDFTGGVPAQIVFSAAIADLTGFVLHVNGVPALAFQAPAPFVNAGAAGGLVAEGLARQFEVDGNYFQAGPNRIEVTLYSAADPGVNSGIDFRLHASTETDRVTAIGSPWLLPNGTHRNEIVVGGSPSNPLATPLLVLSDNYFTMRYKPKDSANNVAGTGWSRWMPPKLVEGWIKRVLAGINPFNQRVGDLYNNAVNTDVSILTQAGKRWEGDIALSLENIDQFGLIEIYETVLNRGKTLSIDAGYDYGAANDALLLAAGYLNDLYTLLGNEAYADAANPTIAVDDSTITTEVNTARFSFEGQVASVLEEELALLRGRDDRLSPGVGVAPAYNRLYWNYTRGILSGEAIYAVNYNIREKAGGATADGTLDAADAQLMFPQGHGDAYGHYLTALKGYYRLLTNPSFTWTPRIEAVSVLGQTVAVDYFDERKFADSAANLARTAQQVVGLTHRQAYRDDPAAGWSSFRDSAGGTGHWGLDEWTSRATQGAFYHWIVANALVPDVDNDSGHTGIQKVDRTTIPSLRELAASGETLQATIDAANAHLNPLGLSPGAIAFDISAADLKAGTSHYEQVYERALRATLNAKGAFDQASRMNRLLRSQENQLGDNNAAIVDQERAYVKHLIEIYGTPYTASVGAGKTYAQGYVGPDTQEWFVIDRPTSGNGPLVDNSEVETFSMPTRVNIRSFTTLNIDDILSSYAADTVEKTITLEPNRFVQYADVWAGPGGSMGARAVVGTLQQALSDAEQARIALLAGGAKVGALHETFRNRHALYNEMVRTRLARLRVEGAAGAQIDALSHTQFVLENAAGFATAWNENVDTITKAFAEAPPKNSGASNDATSPIRAFILKSGAAITASFRFTATKLEHASKALELAKDQIESSRDGAVEALGFSYREKQVAYEFGLIYQELTQEFYQIAQQATALQQAVEKVRTILAAGERLQEDREIFRQRAAALIQGYRTKDVTFRTFRNEALEQYRSLYDLASRYTYLAAKSYDYETGLLGSAAGTDVLNRIVAARALGDLTGGVPQATVSTTGDAGLAGTMARLQADWSVAKGRLGINNPDQNGTLFSLRRELFRLVDDPAETDDDAQWQQTLEQHIMSDIMADPDVAAQARNLRRPDGGPVPGIVIPFRTAIQHGQNFFGLELADGDHAFSPSSFSTKIYSAGLVFRGYVGMDPYRPGSSAPNVVFGSTPNALSATPYVYLIPTGTDTMRAPPLGDTDQVRGWKVADQALPLPFNLGATAFSSTQFYGANETLSERPWVLRKHQAFRPVSDANFFYSSVPAEFTSSRLVGRSVWNTGWKIVIPAYTLFGSESEGLNRFTASVQDIELFLRTYSNAGN